MLTYLLMSQKEPGVPSSEPIVSPSQLMKRPTERHDSVSEFIVNEHEAETKETVLFNDQLEFILSSHDLLENESPAYGFNNMGSTAKQMANVISKLPGAITSVAESSSEDRDIEEGKVEDRANKRKKRKKGNKVMPNDRRSRLMSTVSLYLADIVTFILVFFAENI